MIIIRLIGGLGNQLFIYSFARYLELKYNLDVFIDTKTGFARDSYRRRCELINFHTSFKEATFFNSLYFTIRKRFTLLNMYLHPGAIYISESDKRIDNDSFINLYNKHKLFFEGYWQQEKYYNEFVEILSNELKVKSDMIKIDRHLLNEINTNESVGIHIRRIKYAPVLPLKYYYEAIEKISASLKNPVFYCFSDDIEWCKTSLKINHPLVFVDQNDNQIQDFWLLSKCKHFIISNSTFAWWSEKLSEKNNKITIVPSSEYWANPHLIGGAKYIKVF